MGILTLMGGRRRLSWRRRSERWKVRTCRSFTRFVEGYSDYMRTLRDFSTMQTNCTGLRSARRHLAAWVYSQRASTRSSLGSGSRSGSGRLVRALISE